MKTNNVLSDEQFNQMMVSLSNKIQPIVEAKAHDAMNKAGMSKIERKHAIFPGQESGSKSERSYQFFKAVLGGDILGAKALSEGAASSGGYLVPSGFREEIIARLPNEAELAPYVRVVPVFTDSGTLPSLASDISLTWRGGSTPAENQTFVEQQPVLGGVTWNLKRADAITKISRELAADSQPSIIEFITRLFQEAISAERDRMIAVGDDSTGTEPQGIENATLNSGNIVTIDGALSYAGLVEIEHSLLRKYRRNARWVMNSNNLHRIFALTDTNGRPLFTRENPAGEVQTYVMGYPVSVQDDLDDGNIFLGDLGNYLWFDRGEMGVESTTCGGDAFENHQVWVKVWERADGKLALDEAFSKGAGITS